MLGLTYSVSSIKPGSQYDAGASVASSLVHNNYNSGAYVASVASGNARLEPVSNPAFPDASLLT